MIDTTVTTTDIRPQPQRLVPPLPPDDDEKYSYLQRNLPYLATVILLGSVCVIISQLRFELHDLVLSPFLAFTVVYVVYQAISLPVNFAGRGFDLAAHQARIAAWQPETYPDIDVYLPICGEPLELLRNTWTAVAALAGGYPGQIQVHVLDDGPDEEARAMAAEFGYHYIHREDWPAGKKAGNLRYAFGRTSAELFVIFDADFAPRPDFLAETLPYLDDPRIAIVQTPQFFRSHPGQTWIERAAGPIQEIFYRAVQVARNRLDAAVCCGTSAVYRRRALEPFGGPTLIPYAEDVHTGLDVRRDGWSVSYLPIVLSTGICPDNLDSFVRQQYRWCSGNVGIVFSWRLWKIPMSLPGPAHLHLRVPLLRLHRAAGVLRAADPHRHAGLSARPDPAAQLPGPAPGHVHRVRAVPAVAPGPVRAGHLAAGHRPRLGARVRDLGRRLGPVDELAPDPDAGQLAAAVPARGDLVERERGRGVAGPGRVAHGQPGRRHRVLAVRGAVVLRLAQLRRGEPRHRPRKQARMKSRLVVAVALALALASVSGTVSRVVGAVHLAPPRRARHAGPAAGRLPGRVRAGGAAGLRPGAELRPGGGPASRT